MIIPGTYVATDLRGKLPFTRVILAYCKWYVQRYASTWFFFKWRPKLASLDIKISGDHLFCFRWSRIVTSVRGKNIIKFSAWISRSNQFTVPIICDERVITIDISKSIWDSINQEEFLQGIKIACCTLEATYACRDYEAIVAKSICTGGFRYFGVNSYRINPETRLPGIYWAQYVTQEMVKETGNLQEIENEARCEVKDILCKNKGIWLQLTHDFWKTQREDRLALRKYSSRSLYMLSLHDIAKCIRRDMIPVIDFLPLENPEITEIERIRKNIWVNNCQTHRLLHYCGT